MQATTTKLLTLAELAEQLGAGHSYKSIYNRLDTETGIIEVAGRQIPAHKDKGAWYVWTDDLDTAQPIRQPDRRPQPKHKPKSTASKRGSFGADIDTSRSRRE